MERLRIAQMVSGRVINGAVRHCFMLCNELAARGHEVTLCHRPQLPVGDEVAPSVRRLQTPFPLTLGGVMTVGNELRTSGVQVMHTHMSDAHSYGVLIRKVFRIAVVATAHSSHLQLHWAFNDRVIAPSQATAAFHRRVNRVKADRISVIPNFLDLAGRAVATAESRLGARQHLGLAADALVVGSVGEINFKKRQSDLIEAVSLTRSTPAGQLVLVGGVAKDPEARRVERAAPRLGQRLVWLGARKDVPDILPAFDIFALSSRAEEAPIAVLEAMAAGLPVVATDVGGLAQMVEHGETGWLSAAARPAEQAGNLDRLLADQGLRARMGVAGRAKVERDFAPGPIMDRVEAVLAQAAGLTRGP